MSSKPYENGAWYPAREKEGVELMVVMYHNGSFYQGNEWFLPEWLVTGPKIENIDWSDVEK